MPLPTRQQSLELLHQYIKNPALLRHCHMVAAATESYAQELGEDVELWWATGLLHDLDWEAYPDEHPNKALTELLADYPVELRQAVAAHAPGRTGQQPASLLDKYLFACDEISGFINAASLMRPDGLHGMQPKSVIKKLKDKSFAANVSRDDIRLGVQLIDKPLDQHIQFLIGVFEQLGAK